MWKNNTCKLLIDFKLIRQLVKRLIISMKNIEQVNEFIYIPGVTSKHHEYVVKNYYKLTPGEQSVLRIDKDLKSYANTRETKCAIYRTLLRSVVIFGSETWSLTKKVMNDYMRALRKQDIYVG